MSKYVIALKRDQRMNAPKDWFKPLLASKRLKIISPVGGRRILVESDDKTVARLRRDLAPLCHIEEAVYHERR